VLLAAVSDVTPPMRRGASLGVYRLWRDGGYAIGGIVIGLVASGLNSKASFFTLAIVLFVSAALAAWWMRETHPRTTPAAGVLQ